MHIQIKRNIYTKEISKTIKFIAKIDKKYLYDNYLNIAYVQKF